MIYKVFFVYQDNFNQYNSKIYFYFIILLKKHSLTLFYLNGVFIFHKIVMILKDTLFIKYNIYTTYYYWTVQLNLKNK